MSKTNRTRGHDFERDCARHLSAMLFLDVRSARSVEGGRQAGADLVTMTGDGARDWTPTIHGWSVECKASTNSHQVTAWMRQAKQQSDSDLYVVIASNYRKPVEDSTVYLTSRALRWWLYGGSEVFVPNDDVRFMSLASWCDVLDMGEPRSAA